jgi:hypothetical protein
LRPGTKQQKRGKNKWRERFRVASKHPKHSSPTSAHREILPSASRGEIWPAPRKELFGWRLAQRNSRLPPAHGNFRPSLCVLACPRYPAQLGSPRKAGWRGGAGRVLLYSRYDISLRPRQDNPAGCEAGCSRPGPRIVFGRTHEFVEAS